MQDSEHYASLETRVHHLPQFLLTLCSLLFGAVAFAQGPTGLTPTDEIESHSAGLKADYGVATSIGTATYSYPFQLPPGRQGLGPTLGLSYSSATRAIGTIAEGWSLRPVPTIRRDVTRETGSGSVYTVDWGDGPEELIQTHEPSRTARGGLTFRLRYDGSFTRFEAVATSLYIDHWIARMPDGHTYFFGETNDSKLVDDWRLSSMVDRWGNTVRYQWWPVYDEGTPGIQAAPQATSPSGRPPVDLALAEIDYTTNPAAGQENAYARVRLVWNYRPNSCNYNDPSLRRRAYPAGSVATFRSGTLEVNGFWRLEQVVSETRKSPRAIWQEAHEWNLNYDSLSEICGGKVSPRRRLSSVSDVGEGPAANPVRTNGPEVNFRYGSSPDFGTSWRAVGTPAPLSYYGRPSNFSFYPVGWPDPQGEQANGLVVNLCGGHVTGGGFYSMLLDMDGDGLPDLLRTDGQSCRATWYKNNGAQSARTQTQFGTRGGTFQLPPSGGVEPGDSTVTAGCNLSGAWFARRHVPTSREDCPYLTSRTRYNYLWADVDGDGKVDLVVGGWGNGWPATNDTRGRTAPKCTNPICAIDPASPLCMLQECRYCTNPIDIGNLPPPPNGNCLDYRPDAALRCGDGSGYVWVVFHDIAERGIGFPEVWCSPVALGDNPRDPAEARMPAPASDLFALIDMNGDGLADIVSASINNYVYDSTRGLWCPSSGLADTSLVFNVFFGDGHGKFARHELWWTPVEASQCSDHQPRRSWLVDINGDGLPDLVHEVQSADPSAGSSIWVTYNTGHGFSAISARILQPSRALAPRNDEFLSCPNNVPRFLADVDGDGVIDIASMYGEHPELAYGIAFGGSLGYFAYSPQADALEDVRLPGSTGVVRAGRTAQVWTNGWWEDSHYSVVGSDFIDLDGNGVRDRYAVGAQATSFQLQSWLPPADSAPGLLTEVRNGRGGIVRFHYARSTDDSVVELNANRSTYAASWSDWIRPSLPATTWVVKEVEVSSDDGATFARTDYHYADPVSGPELLAFASDGTSVISGASPRLHGFQATTVTLPANTNEAVRPHVFERYSYRLLPTGLLDYRALREWATDPVSGQPGLMNRTVDGVSYQALPMFDTRLRFVAFTSQWHIECQPSLDDNACDAQRTFRREISPSWFGWPSFAPAVYTSETTSLAARGDLSDVSHLRTHQQNHLIVDVGAAYLVMPKSEYDIDGEHVVARVDYFYDGSHDIENCGNSFGPCKGALTMRRVYRKAAQAVQGSIACDPSTCVDEGAWYDAFGNLIQMLKPSAMLQAQDDPSSTSAPHLAVVYDDAWSLFPKTVISETNQQIRRSFDISTGHIIEEQGPNSRWILSCGGLDCIGILTSEGKKYNYDGLGRLTAMSETRDEGSFGFVLHPVLSVEYSSLPSYYVTEHKALGWDSTATWVNRRIFFDGFDRPIAEHLQSPGLALSARAYEPAGNAYEAYRYDTRGPMRSVVRTHPDVDMQTIETTYVTDARGRVTSVTVTGIETLYSYSPLRNTVRDADGKVRIERYDAFGQLAEVTQGDGTLSRTQYVHDALGRLSETRDADGNTATYRYDDAGELTALARPGSRVWQYAYHPNGELASMVDPDRRVTKYFYDAQGRMTDEYDDPQLDANPETAQQLARQYGVGHIQFVYDTPDMTMAGVSLQNRDGRLSTVSFYGGSSLTAYASIAYGYDGMGHIAGEVWSLNRPETGSVSYALSRSFAPFGREESLRYPNGQTASWTYDTRGMLQNVTVAGLNAGTYTYTLGGKVHVATAFGGSLPLQERTFGYDAYGHTTSDQLSVSSTQQSLHRTYHYTSTGDLDSLSVDDRLSDASIQASFGFTYDDSHRLATASVTTSAPLTYNAGLHYHANGNLEFATVTGSFTALPDRPEVSYRYDTAGVTADINAPTNLVRSDGTNLASFSYDRSGNLTTRLVDANERGAAGLSTRFAYDTHGQIRRANGLAQSNTWEQYFYDHRHRRFLTLTSTGWRLNIGNEYEVDLTSNGVVTRAYVPGAGGVLARVQAPCADESCAPQVSLFHKDRRGDVLGVVDSNGAFRVHFIYGAFGEILYAAGSTGDVRWRLNDKEQDVEQLSYYGHRYYDPLSLRWTTPDLLARLLPESLAHDPEQLNLYAFSHNNPEGWLDVVGMQPQETEGEVDTGYETPPMLAGPLGPIPDPDLTKLYGNQPWNLFVGNRAHVNIATAYAAEHLSDLVFANFFSISSILGKTNTGTPDSVKRSLLALEPDIVNWTTAEIYEIRPDTDVVGAREKLNLEIGAFGLAGVPMRPGSSVDPGANGTVPAPNGFYEYWSPEPGVIVYHHYQLPRYKPIPVFVPDLKTSRSRATWEILKAQFQLSGSGLSWGLGGFSPAPVSLSNRNNAAAAGTLGAVGAGALLLLLLAL